jgi:DNA-directed RNA polymerase subunit M/transcription elongation factor TFIIS
MPPNNELPVLPMTAIDEITYRTPDALFNGSAVVNVIQSCIPSIKDAWAAPGADINSILVSIRIASFGHDMEINSACPKCGHNHALTIDLRTVLDSLGSPNYDESVSAGDLTCYFAPMTYRQVNEVSRTNFEDQKIMQALSNSEMPEEEKLKKLGDAFRKITELTIKSISESIAVIKTADAMVTDKPSILEFLQNCPKHVFDQIRDHTTKLREATDLTPVSVTCEECSEQYKQPFTLDMSNFFGNAS